MAALTGAIIFNQEDFQLSVIYLLEGFLPQYSYNWNHRSAEWVPIRAPLPRPLSFAYVIKFLSRACVLSQVLNCSRFCCHFAVSTLGGVKAILFTWIVILFKFSLSCCAVSVMSMKESRSSAASSIQSLLSKYLTLNAFPRRPGILSWIRHKSSSIVRLETSSVDKNIFIHFPHSRPLGPLILKTYLSISVRTTAPSVEWNRRVKTHARERNLMM